MSQFTTPLIVKHLDGRIWELAEPFKYHVGSYPSKRVIIVPKTFQMDFASIPRVFWSILPPTGLYGKAAVIHDWLYRQQWFTDWDRKAADVIFLEAMQVLNVPKWKRVIIYRAVRLFGWNAYRKRANEFKSFVEK